MRFSSDWLYVCESLTRDASGRRAFGPAARTVLRPLLAIPLLALALLAALMLVPALAGFERYVITGGSMGGSYDRGSIVYEDAVPVSELRVGDVITFQPPRSSGVEGSVTHRIARISSYRGEPIFRTKGDANPHRDPWRFRLEESTQARAVFAVPYIGYAFAALGVRWVRVAVIGLPALLIALVMLGRLWREAGVEARRRSQPGAPPGEAVA